MGAARKLFRSTRDRASCWLPGVAASMVRGFNQALRGSREDQASFVAEPLRQIDVGKCRSKSMPIFSMSACSASNSNAKLWGAAFVEIRRLVSERSTRRHRRAPAQPPRRPSKPEIRIERVFERKPVLGGKARSIPVPNSAVQGPQASSRRTRFPILPWILQTSHRYDATHSKRPSWKHV